MSEELRRRLRQYEAEYPGQPLVAQRADLEVINRLRSQLGLPFVDARLKEVGVACAASAAEPEPDAAPDHTEARAIYQTYLKKVEELRAHQEYAEHIARATDGRGQTPVRPLATMGTGGGPLLCDHCRKPIVLEGGKFHGVPADVAWRRNPQNDWTSWIFGGLVVEIQTNGTLRIYHGYPGRDAKQCCNAARRKDEEAQARFESRRTPETFHLLREFVEYEFPSLTERERQELLNDVLNTVFAYDPGVGVNRPDGAG